MSCRWTAPRMRTLCKGRRTTSKHYSRKQNEMRAFHKCLLYSVFLG